MMKSVAVYYNNYYTDLNNYKWELNRLTKKKKVMFQEVAPP